MEKTHIAPFGVGLVLAAAIFGGSPAEAFTPVCTGCNQASIDYAINGLSYDVTHIVVFGQAGVINDNFLNQAGQFSAPAGSSTIAALFAHGPVIASTFMIGVTTEIPGEPGGALVLFTNNAFASSHAGQDFNTIFASILSYDAWYTDYNVANSIYNTGGSIADESNPSDGEATLINDLEVLPGGGLPDLDLLHFAAGDPHATPFPLAGAIDSVGFAPGDSFTAIAFSGGQIVGHGTSQVLAVPEPASWALMLGGVFGAGAVLRRRRAAAPAG